MIRIMRYGEIPDEKIFFRGEIKTDVAGIVSDILANVKKNGDAALREYAERFDGGVPESLEVTQSEYNWAEKAVDPALLDIMRQAAENITADIPTVMIDEKVEDILRNYASQFGMRDNSVSLDEIKKMMGKIIST